MNDNEKLDLILSEVKNMRSDMHVMKGDIQGMKDDIQGIKDEMQGMKDDIQCINLVLENEIRVNIKRVTEGHLDLSRNLHAAMQPNNEVEMLSIKVHKLESDMRMVKEKVGCV